MDWTTATIGQALRDTAARTPDRIAVTGLGRRLSFAALDQDADRLAHGLAALGVGRGDSVALWMTNCPDWVSVWMACVRLGAMLVPVNTRFKPDEVAYILRQSDARVLIGMDRFWDIDYAGMIDALVPSLAASAPGGLQDPALPELRAVVWWEAVSRPGCTHLQALREEGERRLARGDSLPPAQADDPVIIVYTSGTTGHPKGAVHGHRVMRNAANVARVMRIGADDIILGHMPFYHVAGAFTAVIPMVMLGCTLVTLAQWVPDEALDTIARERVTIFGGIPTHFIDCLDAIRRRPRDVSCLRSAWIGGAPVTPDVALAARAELGLQSLQAVYGMTETTAATVFSEHDAPLSVLCENKGRPIGEFEVAVCDPATGAPRPVGEVGEVRVRGHLVMQGYYRNPQATAEAITPDGWFRTGDLGQFDAEGYLKITGRLKEMFIVGGSNAYPAEIERLLQALPEIRQAVVVGVPDRRLGEVGFAFLQLHEGARLDAAALRERCRGQMADYKVPRHVAVLADFPRTSTGKIQRSVLQAMAREQVGQGGAG
ncbi:MAG: AMP-binding protein [Betaproteobacteria bacterium]|nr:AMP-binding protein [Betaproteobacteria bacterium]